MKIGDLRTLRFNSNRVRLTVEAVKTILVATILFSVAASYVSADTKISASVSIGSAPASASVSAPAKGKGPPPWAPAHGRRAKHSYRYFPGQEVYYRPSDGVWFYLDGGRWSIGAKLPLSIKVDTGAAVALDMDTDKPFSFHADVRATYGGAAVKEKVADHGGGGGGSGKGNGKGKGKGGGK